MSLTEERVDEIEEGLSAFPFSLLQDFMAFKNQCKLKSISIEEVIEYMKYIKSDLALVRNRKKVESMEALLRNSPLCAICGNILELQSINDHPTRMVDESSNSWWVCPDMFCDSTPILEEKKTSVLKIELGVPIESKKIRHGKK